MAQELDKFLKSLQASGLPFAAAVEAYLAASLSKPKDGEQLARLLVKEKKLTAYQAQELYAGRGRRLVLGNYLILDKLGQGGMGMVLKAEHRRMERVVALKVLSSAALNSPDSVKRFQREVKAAAKLTHPNIVAAFDADEAGGTNFLVMEYVEGTDLSQLVKKSGPVTVEKALTCVVQAARGLEFAHDAGIIHRDIKPANLLLDLKGNVKILDMGLARIDSVGGDQAELTGTGQIMGTVDYMAPEQAMNTKKADARADIYSLGITLWYLLTGRCAYAGDTVMEKLMGHQRDPIPSLLAVCPGVSPALDAVFMKMIAKTPEQRYQSMGAVLAAIERCKEGDADVAPTINLPRGEETKLSEFLKGPAATQPSRTSVSAVAPASPSIARTAPPSSTADGNEQTIVTNSPQSDTDPQTQTGLRMPVVAQSPTPVATATKASAPPPWWMNPTTLIGAGTGTVVLLVLAGWFMLSGGGDVPLANTPPSDTRPGVPSHGAPPAAIAPFNAAQARAHQGAWAKHLGVQVEYTNDVGMKFVLIPPGEFLMGSTPAEIAGALLDAAGDQPVHKHWQQSIKSESPQHKVVLTQPFYLGVTEVTQKHTPR